MLNAQIACKIMLLAHFADGGALLCPPGRHQAAGIAMLAATNEPLRHSEIRLRRHYPAAVTSAFRLTQNPPKRLKDLGHLNEVACGQNAHNLRRA